MAVSRFTPRSSTNIPAIEASAAPKPPGSAEMAPMMVEKERMKTAIANVFRSGLSPRPNKITKKPIPSANQEIVPRETAAKVARGRKRVKEPS